MNDPLDSEIVASLRELADGDSAFVPQMVDLYVKGAAEKLPKIAKALAENHLQDVASLCHQLKSSSGNLGAVALGKLFERLEAAALANDKATADKLCTEVMAAYPEVEAALKKL
jgi:HPt (histidine-containing phosphotransfer) domain-containing protein